MFKAVIDGGLLKTILQTLDCTVDEARWNISGDGITVKSVDPANVLMTYLKIPAAAFEYYKADTGVIGLDVAKMVEIISDTKDGEKATLELDEEKSQLKIGVENMHWNFSLIDPSAIRPEPRIPEVDLPTMVAISGADLRRIIKASMKVTDHILMSVTEDAFVASAVDNLQQVEAKIPLTDIAEYKPGESRSLFSLDYLDDMSKAAMKSEIVRIWLGVDYPLKMDFRIGTAVISAAPTVEYMMAPRIETD